MKPDRVFPQLLQALDPDCMMNVLQSTFAHNLRIESCNVDEVRHKPGKRCLLSYRLDIHDKTIGARSSQLVTARLLRANEPVSAAESATATVLAKPAMLIWLFPADSKLPYLDRLFDQNWLTRALVVTLQPLGFGQHDRVRDIHTGTVHYIPQRSCIVRCEFEWLRSDDVRSRRSVLFAKQYADNSGAATFSVMTQLQSQWRYGARALHYEESSRTLWQCRLPGLPLSWERLQAADRQALIEDIADCVVTLHQSVVRCEQSFGIGQIVEQLEQAVRLAQELESDIALRTRKLTERLLTQLQRLNLQPALMAPLHRDLKLINFLYDDNSNRLSLIDMDCVESGDPVIDLASLIGNLYLSGLRAGSDGTAIEQIVTSLIGAYQKQASISLQHLRWHIAASMVYEVLRRSIRQHNEQRLRHVNAYLQIGEDYCAELESSTIPGARVKHLSELAYGEEFSGLLQPDRVKAILSRYLPRFGDGGVSIKDCRIGHTHYKWYRKPASRDKSRLSVCYHLTLDDGHSESRQIFYAKAYLNGRSAAVAGPDVLTLTLPGFDLLLWQFPHDPGLIQLPQLIQPELVRRSLPYTALPRAYRQAEQIKDITVDIVNYRPEQRCLTRYYLHTAVAGLTLYAKTFAADDVSLIYQRIDDLSQRSRQDPHSFLIARPLHYDAVTRTIWQEALPGKPLLTLLNRNTYVLFMKQIADGLVRLHNSRLSSPLRLVPGEQLAEVGKKAEKLITAMPQLQQTLQTLLQNLDQCSAGLPDTLQAKPIHNDFHCDQLLLCGDRMALFDFDELALGDPAQDLADFALELYLKPQFDLELANTMAAALIRNYCAQADWDIGAGRLHWYFQLKCLTRAYRLYWQQAADLPRQIEQLLQLAQSATRLSGLTNYGER